jgi:hypothetical protein
MAHHFLIRILNLPRRDGIVGEGLSVDTGPVGPAGGAHCMTIKARDEQSCWQLAWLVRGHPGGLTSSPNLPLLDRAAGVLLADHWLSSGPSGLRFQLPDCSRVERGRGAAEIVKESKRSRGAEKVSPRQSGRACREERKKNTNEYVDITRVVVYPSGCAGQSECARTLLNRCVGLGAYL